MGLVDKKNHAHKDHYSSLNANLVTRSVLAANLYALSYAVDFASLLQKTISNLFGRLVQITNYTYSKAFMMHSL